MISAEIMEKLMRCFDRSFINGCLEFIAHEKANEYIGLKNCETELDVQCKVLEWFSRASYKTEPYRTRAKNEEFHNFMRNGVNRFLGTEFTEEDMEQIYTYLGNRCNHEKTVRFIENGYNMEILKEDRT